MCKCILKGTISLIEIIANSIFRGVYKALYSRIALQPWKNVGTKGIPINRRRLDKA